MMARERAWLGLGLWLLSFLPAAWMFANWSGLPRSAMAPTSWWLLLSSAVPTGWVLFEVFFRPREGLRRAALPLLVLFAAIGLGVWRVVLWARQPDEIRDLIYLWPLLVLAFPALWARRTIRVPFGDFPRYPHPAGLVVGINAAMLALALGACLYIFSVHEEMADRTGAPTFTDTRAGFILIFLALELTRRSFGPPLPTLALIAILYGLWGNLVPDPFGHGGAGWIELVGKLSTDFIGGVFGFLVVISATFIIMFLILGAFLHESGAGRFFVQFSLGLFGRLRAGPGLAAVGSSALMGTVSGSASGNVITTGTFTIPLMKRVGYSPYIAGAAEAAASSGGQIMPPVMGAGAFIMSELIEVPYIQLIAYAAIPAVLYFLIVGINIHFAAAKLNLQPLPREEIPDWRAELRAGWFYLVPLAFLIYFLMEGRTPVFAGVMSVFIMVAIWFYRFAAEFLAGLRVGEREVSDEGYVFVPITFWVYLVVVYAVLYGLEAWLGWPLSLGGPPTWPGALRAALALGVVGIGVAAAFLGLTGGGWALWHEVERGWLVIYPLGAVWLWTVFEWQSGTAGAFLLLGAMGLWAARRGVVFRPISLIPWFFVLIWSAAFGLQYGLYTLVPAFWDLAEYVRPFGFVYHTLILFALGAAIQQLIWAFAPDRAAGDGSPVRVNEVAAVSCNPILYLARARRGGRAGPDVAAAEGASRWLGNVRRALEVGGRQGAEFGVTLATIELVVQVLSITGVGNKFAFLIEALAHDVCFFGVAPGGGCVWYIGLDGFFVGLLLTAVACAILGMGMPTTAAYVLLAILGGPVLIKLIGPELVAVYGEQWTREFIAAKGDRVASHMFIFYFAILSAITPPVAIASLVAAKLAGAPYFRTSMMSLRFAIAGFVVPFLFMYEPSLLLFDHPARVVFATLMTLFAFTAFSAGTQGWLLERLYVYERLLLFASFFFLAFFIVYFTVPFLAAGLVTGGIPLIRQLRKVFRPAG